MKLSRRARRMMRHHKRAKKGAAFNLISLMDIFTILVFFLLVNSSEVEVLPNSKAIQLPESVAEQKPNETLRVMVTEETILLQDRAVVQVRDVENSQQAFIPSLSAALQAEGKRHLLNRSDKPSQEVTIMGDKAIPYQLLKKVMLSCTQAGFSKISLSVMQKTRS